MFPGFPLSSDPCGEFIMKKKNARAGQEMCTLNRLEAIERESEEEEEKSASRSSKSQLG